MHQTATRLSCFAVLSAIEDDLRAYISDVSVEGNLDSFMPQPMRQKAKARHEAEFGDDTPIERDAQLLDYIDFGELSQCLDCIGYTHLRIDKNQLNRLTQSLNSTVKTRNRVCHSRPLEVEDLPTTLDLGNELVKRFKSIHWVELKLSLKLLESDPTYVLHIKIPENFLSEKSETLNNLPPVDFDDTGFVGRKKDRKDVARHLRGTNPVVTIVGEGGTGKTALALRSLYDLVADPSCPYDLVLWKSLKHRSLTPGGIRSINNSLKSALEVTVSLLEDTGEQTEQEEDPISSLISLLTENKVLLAIDNLETVQATSLRGLYTQVPSGSKILFTSRIGIGEAEVRYPLESLKPEDADRLARSYARVLNANTLASVKKATLNSYNARLFFNPLLIKWFIANVSKGMNPQQLLNHRSLDLEEAITFCFENLFERLSPAQRLILQTLACTTRPLSDVELRYILEDELEGDTFLWALNQLLNSSILKTNSDKSSTDQVTVLLRSLSDIASKYIRLKAKPSRELRKSVNEKLKEIQAISQQDQVSKSSYKYNRFLVYTRNRHEKVPATILHKALAAIRRHEYSVAVEEIQRAGDIMPEYAEIDRVEAMLNAELDDPYLAQECYESAMEADPENVQTLVDYSKFLLHQDDYTTSLELVKKAIKLDKDEQSLKSHKAMVLARIGEYEEAVSIYVTLLATQQMFGKWEASTRINLADTYKRWSEQLKLHGDVSKAVSTIHKGFDTLDTVLVSQRISPQYRKVSLRLLNELLYTISGSDIVETRYVYNRLKILLLQHSVNVGNLPGLKRAIAQSRELEVREILAEMENLIKINLGKRPTQRAPQTNKQTTIAGLTSKILHEKDFLFIEDMGGRSWFCHVSELPSGFSTSNMTVGTKVTFIPGKNHKGKCATSITIIE